MLCVVFSYRVTIFWHIKKGVYMSKKVFCMALLLCVPYARNKSFFFLQKIYERHFSSLDILCAMIFEIAFEILTR